MKIYNLLILDESGSMMDICEPTITGCNEVLETIQHAAENDTDTEQWVQLITFNSIGIRHRLPLAPATRLHRLARADYEPQASTPLYDAVGATLNGLLKHLGNDTESPVHCTIITDGLENASREYDHKTIKNLIDSLRNRGWDFVFIGANFDVEGVARAMGIHSTIQFMADGAGTAAMYAREAAERLSYYEQKKKHPKAPIKDFNIRLDEADNEPAP